MLCFKSLLFLFALVLTFSGTLRGDGPDDNHPDKVRAVPPPGIELSSADRDLFQKQIAEIRAACNELNGIQDQDRCAIEVFSRALEMTLEHSMFYSEAEVKQGKEIGELAVKRIADYRSGKRGIDLLMATSVEQGDSRLLIGGFRSNLDHSIQPFGLVVPKNWTKSDNQGTPVDIWLHGRDERTSEIGFLYRRAHSIGEIAPANTIVLHPYGRYSNAFKFAGEVDVLESLAFLGTLTKVDDKRIGMRGFSMGGAGCWQMAVHYPERWYAAAPGAGFSETTEFLRVFQNEEYQPTPVQKKLLHMFDCPDWTNNFRMLPVIAYSGELDRQKQAADVMEAAFAKRDMKLQHIIGPGTEHKYHPDSKIAIQEQMNQWSKQGLNDFPEQIDLTTYSLRYPGERWLQLHGLEKHWDEARVIANRSQSGFDIKTQNVSRFEIKFTETQWGTKFPAVITVKIDGESLKPTIDDSAKSVRLLFEESKGKWQRVNEWTSNGKLVKRPGLQGPIDDAFMAPFLFVLPDDKQGEKSTIDRWVEGESSHAMREWRRHFRGDVQKKFASEVTPDDVAHKNLILFGTPSSNSVLGRVSKNLPIAWDATSISVGSEKYSSQDHVPVLIYPNPENQNRYIVVNSGFTFREYAYLNNARQISMLGDWAIVDTKTPPSSRLPGKVVVEGFFDEEWKLGVK